MHTDQEHANVLYGGTGASASTPEPPQKSDSDTELEQRLYPAAGVEPKPTVAPAQAAETAPDAADALYEPAASLQQRFDINMPLIQEARGLSDEQAQELGAQSVTVFNCMSDSVDEIRGLHDVWTAAILNPPSDEQVAAWEKQSRALIAERFGGEAEELTAKARALIAKRPELVAPLSGLGLGNHPRFVMATLEQVRRGAFGGKRR